MVVCSTQPQTFSSADSDLKEIVEHNRDEEIEHAAMTLEWLRRKIPKFDEELKAYLFTSGPITGIEEAVTEKTAENNSTSPTSQSSLG